MPSLIYYCGNKNYSSWSLRAWIALRKAGLDFTTKMIWLHDKTSIEEMKLLSPNGKVPFLQYDDLCFSESIAICEFAAEHAPFLLPKEQKARAWCRAISAEMHSDFALIRKQMPMNCRAQNRRINIDQSLDAELKRIDTIWSQTRNQYATTTAHGPYLFGEFTIADAMYAPVVARFATYQIPCSSISKSYIEAMLSDSDMVEWYKDGATEERIEGYE